MKIYNFGSDYAHQQSLKKKSNQKAAAITETAKETSENNVGNQIQGGGEGNMAPETEVQESPKKTKKKKETGAEQVQSEDLS